MPYADPEKQRHYKREWARMERAGECGTPGGTLLTEAVRANTEAGTLEKARCVGYLAGVALKAIEAGNLAARLEALETVLKQRKETRNDQ